MTCDQGKAEHFCYEKGNTLRSKKRLKRFTISQREMPLSRPAWGSTKCAQFFKFREPRTYISSLGLGTMGFGLPAALGVQVACPDRLVINIDGDGCFLMNIQELATAKIEQINAKSIILNNQHLGMVVQWEDLMYDSVRVKRFFVIRMISVGRIT